MKVLHKLWHELQILFFCSLLKIFIVTICRYMPILNVHLIVMWWDNVIQWACAPVSVNVRIHSTLRIHSTKIQRLRMWYNCIWSMPTNCTVREKVKFVTKLLTMEVRQTWIVVLALLLTLLLWLIHATADSVTSSSSSSSQ